MCKALLAIATSAIAWATAHAAQLSISSTNQYHFVPPVTTNLLGVGMGETADYRVLRYEDIAFLKEAFAERRHVLGLDWYRYWPELRFEDGRWNGIIPASEDRRYFYDWDYTHPEAVEAYFTEYFYDESSVKTNTTPRGKTPSFVTMPWIDAFSRNIVTTGPDYRMARYDPKTDYLAILNASASEERLLANGSIVTNAVRSLGTLTNPGGSSLLIRGGIPSLAAITNAYHNLGLMARRYVIPPSGESYTNYRMTVWHSDRNRLENGSAQKTWARDGDYAISYLTGVTPPPMICHTNDVLQTDRYGRTELPSTTYSYTSRTRIWLSERISSPPAPGSFRCTFYRVRPGGRAGHFGGTTFVRKAVHPHGYDNSYSMYISFPTITTNIARRINWLAVNPVMGIRVIKKLKIYARAAKDALEPQPFGDIVKTDVTTTNNYVAIGNRQFKSSPTYYVDENTVPFPQYYLAVWELNGAGNGLLDAEYEEGDTDDKIHNYTPDDYDPSEDVDRVYPQTAPGLYMPDGEHYLAFPSYVDGIVEEKWEYKVEWLRFVAIVDYDFNAKVITE